MGASKIRAIIIILFIGINSCAMAETPEQILSDAHLLGNDPNLVIDLTMQIETTQGQKERKLEVYINREEDESKLLAQIVHPSFLRNMKFLNHRDKNGREDTWLKTSQGVRRLSTANKSEPLFGSDFTVEDLSYFDTSELQLELIESAGDDIHHLIKATPLSRHSSYSYKVIYIDKGSGIVARVDFYRDKNLYKQYELIEFREINDKLYPVLCRMENFAQDSRTTLFVDHIDIVNAIPGRVFNKGNL
jgi:hypothetical protein